MQTTNAIGEKKFYQKWWFVLIIVLVIFYLLGSSGSSSNTNRAGSVTSNTPAAPAIEVSAVKLAADYNANEVSADATYKGKLVKATGIVSSIGKDILSTPYVSLSDGKQYSINVVQCMFSRSDEAELAKVSKGSSITLQGVVSGMSMMNVIVEACQIVK